MFSRSRNTNSQKPKKTHSLENLKYVYGILQRNLTQSDCQPAQVVESLRLFSEIIVWGDQNDGSIMDFFLEQSALELLIDYVKKPIDRSVSIQLLQTFNILFENLSNQRALYYLLSQNHANEIILYEDYDFNDDEVIGYYIALLKSLSFRVNEDTINFFYDETEQRFPLYMCTVRFFNHPESMVRTAVRTITLNIFKIVHIPSNFYVYAYTAVPYFAHITNEMRKTALAINDCVCLANSSLNRGRVQSLLAEQLDYLHYIDDILSLGISDLADVLFLLLLQRLILPLYVYSLTKRHPPSTSDPAEFRTHVFHAVAMFLLSQVLTILHQPDLVRVLTEAILIGDLTLLCSSASVANTTGASETTSSGVVAELRAAHHSRRSAKLAPAGQRLSSFISTIGECGCSLRCENLKNCLEEDILLATKAICGLDVSSSQNNIEKTKTIPLGNPEVKNKRLGPDAMNKSTALIVETMVEPIIVPPESVGCPAASADVESKEDAYQTTVTDTLHASAPANQSSFVLVGKPFLRAIFRSLEVGPGTDYDTFFALSLLITIKLNGAQDEATLALAEICKTTAESPCNPMLITKLLDIINDASKPGSRVRVVTLNLSLFLLVLVTRDANNLCQLTEHQISQLRTAQTKTLTVLQDFYMTEPDFLDLFEYEVCRYRRFKADPSSLLENSHLLTCHASDAIKLSSNRSEENLHDHTGAARVAPGGATSMRSSSDDVYTMLPISELEKIQRCIAVFLCVHSYTAAYWLLPPLASDGGGGEKQIHSYCTRLSSTVPNEVTAPELAELDDFSLLGNIPTTIKGIISVGDSINTAQHQIFSCEIEHNSGYSEKRYLIITDLQLLFVEPSPRIIGCGNVTFAGLLQESEVKMVALDSRCLSIIVYKPGDRAASVINKTDFHLSVPTQSNPLPPLYPMMNAKLRFQNSMPCITIYGIITNRYERIRASKLNQLRRLLKVRKEAARNLSFAQSEGGLHSFQRLSLGKDVVSQSLASSHGRTASTPSLVAQYNSAKASSSPPRDVTKSPASLLDMAKTRRLAPIISTNSKPSSSLPFSAYPRDPPNILHPVSPQTSISVTMANKEQAGHATRRASNSNQSSRDSDIVDTPFFKSVDGPISDTLPVTLSAIMTEPQSVESTLD